MSEAKVNYGGKNNSVVSLTQKIDEKKEQEENGAFTLLEKRLPPPPSFLDDIAAKHWKMVGGYLEKAGLVTMLDYTSFQLYCETYSHYMKQCEMCRKNDDYVKTPNGMMMVSPWVTERRKALADLTKIQEKLGLTPYARKAMRVADESQMDLDL